MARPGSGPAARHLPPPPPPRRPPVALGQAHGRRASLRGGAARSSQGKSSWPRRRAAQICTLLLAPASARFLHLAAATAAPPLRGPGTGRRAGGRRSLRSGRPGGCPPAPPPQPALPQSPVNVGSGVPEVSGVQPARLGLPPCVQRKGLRAARSAQCPSPSNCNDNHGDHL